MPYDTTKYYPIIMQALIDRGANVGGEFRLLLLHQELITKAKINRAKTRREHINNLKILGYIRVRDEHWGTILKVE